MPFSLSHSKKNERKDFSAGFQIQLNPDTNDSIEIVNETDKAALGVVSIGRVASIETTYLTALSLIPQLSLRKTAYQESQI